MAVAVTLPVFGVVTVVVVIETKRKSLFIVSADIRITPYGIAVRQG